MGPMLGELQNKRIEQGYTLVGMSNRLAIPVQDLAAIEELNLNALPPLIYVKGFVRSYAQALGMSPEPFVGEISALYAGETVCDRTSKKFRCPSFLKILLIPFAFQTEWVAWVVIILMLLGGWTGYSQFTTSRLDSTNLVEASILDEESENTSSSELENRLHRNFDPTARPIR